MRLIGHLNDDASARLFGDYLSGLEIGNRVERESDGAWAVWVLSEEHLDVSRQWLDKFVADPKNPCFAQTAAKAGEIKQRQACEQSAYEGRVRTPSMIWRNPGLGMATIVLIGASVLAALASGFDGSGAILDPLRISVQEPFLREVHEGEIWRLITPIFIHFGPIHLLFNMLWLKDLGSIIEYREGSLKLILMVAIVAALSNFAEYYHDVSPFNPAPNFGGMSGVVFGLFGYVWIRGKFDPRSGYYMDSTNVSLMIAWFFLCVFGIVGHVANTVHAVGLGTGMVWGWVSAMWSQRD